jgi:hypothetical protein
MKKILLFAVAAAAVAFYGCASDSPSGPAAPTPTPVTLAAGQNLDDFEDNNLVFSGGGAAGSWVFGNDLADGGTSVITAAGITDVSFTGAYALKITATVNTIIAYPGSNMLTSLVVYNRVGYVTASMVFDRAVSLAQNAGMTYSLYVSDMSGLDYKICFLNSLNQSVYSASQSVTTSYSLLSYDFSQFTVPSGAAYTAADVLKSVKKITFAIRYRTYADSAKGFNAYFDDFKLTGI